MVVIFLSILVVAQVPLADESKSSKANLVEKVLATYKAQQEFQFSSQKIIEVNVEMNSQAAGASSTEREANLCAFTAQGGIFATRTRYAGSNEMKYSVKLENPKYGAYLSGSVMRKRELPDFKLSDLGGNEFAVDTIWDRQTSEGWFERTVRDVATARYFNFGNVKFDEAIGAWRAADGQVEITKVEGRDDLLRMSFSPWPSMEEMKLSYDIDVESFAIARIVGEFTGFKGTLSVNEFEVINGTPIPRETVLRNKGANSLIIKKTSWKVTDFDSTAFSEEQLYFDYYGLPAPDLEGLPGNKSSNYFLIVAGIIALGGAAEFTRRKFFQS